jgi:RND family efflux transporter MFP subunit
MRNTIKTFMSLAMVVIAALVIQACTDSKGEGQAIPKSAEPIPVKVMMLKKSTGINTIHASGELSTDDETVLAFKTPGIVDAVYVDEGDRVKKGQLLATLDLTEINAGVAQARFAFEKAERDFQRVTNLFKDSVATLEQLQNTETAKSVAKQQLDAAMFNRSFSEIHAPANGYVLKKFVNAGQVVGVGDPIVLTNGAQSGNWRLSVGVSGRQWSAIALKSKALVTIDALPDQKFEAYVSRKSETSDAQSGSFTIELSVKANNFKLARGMFGAAEIFAGESASSWRLPYDAVLDANGKEGFVFVTTDSNTALKQPVTIDSFDGNAIRISAGLEEATAVIVAGSAYLTDGSPITIIK